MSTDWQAPATVHRTDGEVRIPIADGPLAAMVERFLAEPEEQRHHLVLTHDGAELDLNAVQALHARDDFPGAF